MENIDLERNLDSLKEKIESFRLMADKKGFSKGSPFKKGAFAWTNDGNKIFEEAALIYPGELAGAFTIDDESLYVDLSRTKKFIEDKFKNESKRRKNSMIVQAVIIEYFGLTGNHKRLNDLYFSLGYDDVASIRALNNEKNVAACSERSAVVQNLYAFLGLESCMVAGNCSICEHLEEEIHAFNLIKDEDGYAIFDSTNPVITKNIDGDIVGIAPAVYSLSEEDLQVLLKGDQSGVSVIHNNFEIDQTGNKKNSSTEVRVYRVFEKINEIDREYVIF